MEEKDRRRMGKAIAKHQYPSRYTPGQHWATDRAWDILDRLPVGTLSTEQRAFIAGMIAGALMREREKGMQRGGSLS